MEAFLVSTGLVALAEIGDKTMLLALCLAARWRKPWPILAGILVATLVNHGLSAGAGVLVAGLIAPETQKWLLGAAFLGFAVWALIPDKADDDDRPPERDDASVFWATTVAFFLAELGDKTQIATVALGAQFGALFWVTAGTTLGMMIANAPAVWLGRALADRLPLKAIRLAAAAGFAATGAWVLLT